MSKKDFLSIACRVALIVALAFSFAGCENSAGSGGAAAGGMGQVYIGLARSGGAARTVVPDEAELQSLTIKVTFTGPGGTIEKTFDRQGGTVSLAAGSWQLTAKAYNADRLRAIAEETLQVKSGGTYNIAMTACIGIKSQAELAAALGASGLPGIGHDTASGKGDLLVLESDITTGTIDIAPGNYTLAGGRTITLSGQGSLFTVNSGVTLTLDGPALRGGASNNDSLVYVNSGTFAMKDGSITGNSATRGGGVYARNGSIAMSGGTISGNSATDGGGGVYISGTVNFTMSGGFISDNTGGEGGGVVVYGTFNMSGGTISGNSATGSGGGVYVFRGGFTMSGGTISGNSTTDSGGGMYVFRGGFTMSGGTIKSNQAPNSGGGAAVDDDSTFTMSGGTITENTSYNGGGGVSVTNSSTFNLNSPAGVSSITLNNISGTGSNVFCDANSMIKINGTVNNNPW
jgi:hypothetical protein